MRNFIGALAAVLATAALLPAYAAKRTVVVVPAQVIKGAPGNGPVLTEALRASLKKEGFEVLAGPRVDRALAAMPRQLPQWQTITTLASVRLKTGADYVIYPRVLSVGQGVNTKLHQANILVNVAGGSTKGFAHTRQVGQTFAPTTEEAESSVIGRAEAEQAAAKLMETFYARVR